MHARLAAGLLNDLLPTLRTQTVANAVTCFVLALVVDICDDGDNLSVECSGRSSAVMAPRGGRWRTLAVVTVRERGARADRHVLVVHPLATAGSTVLARVVVGAGVVLATQLTALACADRDCGFVWHGVQAPFLLLWRAGSHRVRHDWPGISAN